MANEKIEDIEDLSAALSGGQITIVSDGVQQVQEDEPEPDTDEQAEGDDGEAEGGDERLGEGRQEDETPENKTERNRLKRQMKKEADRRVKEQMSQVINQQKQMLDTMSKRLSALEGGDHSRRLADMDNAIVGITQRLSAVQDGISKAVEEGDGKKVSSLIAEMNDLTTRKNTLEYTKGAIQNSIAARKEGAEQQVDAVDTRVTVEQQAKLIVTQNNAKQFVKRNPWYDPKLADEDSKLMFQIDKEIAEEGYDPSTPEYWDELEARAKEELPHRFQAQRQAPRKVNTAGTGRNGGTSAQSGGGVQGGVPKSVVDFWKANNVWPEDKAEQRKMMDEYKAGMSQK